MFEGFMDVGGGLYWGFSGVMLLLGVADGVGVGGLMLWLGEGCEAGGGHREEG